MPSKIFLRVGAWYRSQAKLHPSDIELSEIIDNVSAQYPEIEIQQSGGYLVYTALLTQTGTDAPVANVLQNTLGEITFNYGGAGVYDCQSDGLFTLNKTASFIAQTSYVPSIAFYATVSAGSPTNFIDIQTIDTNTGSNDLMSLPTLFEIRVYL